MPTLPFTGDINKDRLLFAREFDRRAVGRMRLADGTEIVSFGNGIYRFSGAELDQAERFGKVYSRIGRSREAYMAEHIRRQSPRHLVRPKSDTIQYVVPYNSQLYNPKPDDRDRIPDDRDRIGEFILRLKQRQMEAEARAAERANAILDKYFNDVAAGRISSLTYRNVVPRNASSVSSDWGQTGTRSANQKPTVTGNDTPLTRRQVDLKFMELHKQWHDNYLARHEANMERYYDDIATGRAITFNPRLREAVIASKYSGFTYNRSRRLARNSFSNRRLNTNIGNG